MTARLNCNNLDTWGAESDYLGFGEDDVNDLIESLSNDTEDNE